MFYRKTDETMEILTMCEIGVKFDRGKDENNHAPMRCSGEHFLNLSAVLFTNGAKLKDDFEIIKKTAGAAARGEGISLHVACRTT